MAPQTFFLNSLELEINVLSLARNQTVVANVIYLIIFSFACETMPGLSFDMEFVFVVFALISFAGYYLIIKFICVCQLVPLFTTMSVGLIIP